MGYIDGYSAQVFEALVSVNVSNVCEPDEVWLLAIDLGAVRLGCPRS